MKVIFTLHMILSKILGNANYANLVHTYYVQRENVYIHSMYRRKVNINTSIDTVLWADEEWHGNVFTVQILKYK